MDHQSKIRTDLQEGPANENSNQIWQNSKRPTSKSAAKTLYLMLKQRLKELKTETRSCDFESVRQVHVMTCETILDWNHRCKGMVGFEKIESLTEPLRSLLHRQMDSFDLPDQLDSNMVEACYQNLRLGVGQLTMAIFHHSEMDQQGY